MVNATGRNQMEWLFRIAMVFWLTVGWVALAVADSPVIIGSSRQLFFDDYVVQKMDGLKRTVHPATKHNNGRPVVVPDQPWEGGQTFLFGSVLYNPDKKLYEMWYRTGPHNGLSYKHGFENPELYDYAYATSADGITWEKPLLDEKPTLYALHEFATMGKTTITSTDTWVPDTARAEKIRAYYRDLPRNNIVLAHQELQGVVYTPDDPDPNQRYKACIFGGTLITSPDGVHWKLGNTFYPGQSNTFNYDPARHL